MSLSKRIIVLAAAVGLSATFLPWKRVSQLGETLSTTGKDTAVVLSTMQIGDGWLVLGLFVLILLLVLTGNRRLPLKRVKAVSIILLSLTIAVVCIYDIRQLSQHTTNPVLQELATISTAGYGLYLALTSGILIFFAALFSRRFRTADGSGNKQ